MKLYAKSDELYISHYVEDRHPGITTYIFLNLNATPLCGSLKNKKWNEKKKNKTHTNEKKILEELTGRTEHMDKLKRLVRVWYFGWN